MPIPLSDCIFTLDGTDHKGVQSFLDHILSKDVTVTPDQEAIDTKEAQEFGFEHPVEAMRSVEKRTGTKYEKFSDIPKKALEKVQKERRIEAFDKKVDEAASKLIKRFTPVAGTKQGVGAEEIIKAGAAIIKKAYHAGDDLKEAVNAAIEYIKDKWDDAWGSFDEKELRTAMQDLADDTITPQQQKVYEEIAGSKPNKKTGRIAVDPIVGKSPKQISEIIKGVSDALNQKIAYAKPGRSRAAGTYAPGSTGIKIRYTGDLDVTAHELGHSIDDRFGVLTDLKTTPDKVLEKELNKFKKFGSTPPKGHPDPRMYRLQEGFAEYLRALIVNPKEAKVQAPELTKLYESKVDEDTRSHIEDFSSDIRTWAGASARDITLANIEWKPEESTGILKQIFSKSKNNDMLAITWVDKMAAKFTNPFQAFNKAYEYAKGIRGIDEVLPEDNPYILARLLSSIDRKFGEYLEGGLRDSKDNLLKDKDGNAMNFKWLIEPFDNTDKATIESDMKDTVAYMIAERTTELSKRFDREEVLTGVGGGIFSDIDIATRTLDEFKTGDPDKLKRIDEAASRYRQFADGILKYMVDKGRLSKEQYDAIKRNNVQYVALNRVMEAEPGNEISVFTGKGGKLGSITQPVQSIKGSTRKITNPYTSLLDSLHRSLKEADRNDVLSAFRDLLVSGRGMHEGEPLRLAEVGMIGKQGDKNAIPIFIDGKPEHWLFQKDVYEALKGLDNDGYRLPGILTWHAKALRATVTKFPTFALRNWIRDLQDRVIKSSVGSGFTDLYGNKEHWKDVARMGGLNSGYYMRDKTHYYGLMNEAVHDMAKKQGIIITDGTKLKELWHGYENMLQKSETANRVAEYRAGLRRGKEQGMDDYNAMLYGAFKSRDLIDFALMGHYMKIVNQIIPFSNAAVQGIRSTIVNAKQNPGAFLARIAVYTIMPQVGLWFWNHRNDEASKQYEELPDYQRDMFWNLKIGDNKWLSIPKPYELGIISSGIDRTLSKTLGHNDAAFTGYAGQTFQALSPIDQGNLAGSFQPEIEVMVNKSFFTGKPIIPAYEEPLDLSLRHTEHASRLGLAAQKIAHIDARKFDYWVRAHFSYTGGMAIKLSNLGDDTKQTPDITDIGFFKRTPAYNSKSVQEMLDYAKSFNKTRGKDFKAFTELAGQYFDAKTDKEKEMISTQMIDIAKILLTEWKSEEAEISNAMHDEGLTRDEVKKRMKAAKKKSSTFKVAN